MSKEMPAAYEGAFISLLETAAHPQDPQSPKPPYNISSVSTTLPPRAVTGSPLLMSSMLCPPRLPVPCPLQTFLE